MIPGWHTYPLSQTDPEAKLYVTAIKFPDTSSVIPVGEFKESMPLSKAMPVLDIKKLLYYEGKVVWERPLLIWPEAKPGPVSVQAEVQLQVCDDNSCCPLKS